MPLDTEKLGKDLDDTTQSGAKDEKTPQLDSKVVEQLKNAGKAELYSQLAQDPEFSQLLQMKQSGKKFKVVEEGTDSSSNASNPNPSPDLEKMSESEKLQYMVSQVTKETSKIVDAKLAPLGQTVEQLKVQATQINLQKINDQITQVKKKYSDFETFEPRMTEIAKENRGLSVEQLYFLAKQEKGGFAPTSRLTASERPSSTTARPHVKREIGQGVVGIREMLPNAIAQTLSRTLGEVESEE